MANISMKDQEASPRKSWTPPPVPASHENDDIDSANIEPNDMSYIGHRLRETRRNVYPGTPDVEDSKPQRRKRQIESDDDASATDAQALSTGPYFDAIRNTYTAATPSVPLSQESLRALNARPGQSSTRVRGWLRDSTQFSVESHRRKKHSVEYMLREDGHSQASPVPSPSSQPQIQREQHECVNCKRIFNTKSELRHHARRYEKRPYNCEQCERSFLYPKDLRRHMTTHDGSKSYQCTSCQKAFSRKDNLRRHMANEHGKEEASYEGANLAMSATANVPPVLPRPSEIRGNDASSQQNSIEMLASAINVHQSMGNEFRDEMEVGRRSENTQEQQAVNDHQIDPTMQNQHHRPEPAANETDTMRDSLPSASAQRPHERYRISSNTGNTLATTPMRDHDDVAIARKALNWDEEDQHNASNESRPDNPNTNTNTSLQTLEVS